MKKVILLAFALVISLGAIATKKTKRKKQVKKTPIVVKEVKERDKVNTMRLCLTPSPQPAWFLEVPQGFKFPPNFQQPAAYRLLSTIDTSFHSFLKSIPFNKSEMKISLPLFMNNTIECKEFIVSRVQTMDSSLQAKYPQLMSFKAIAANNSLNAARIDCDENSVRMSVTFNKEVYFVTSVQFNRMTYYACYAKKDANFVKDKFEK